MEHNEHEDYNEHGNYHKQANATFGKYILLLMVAAILIFSVAQAFQINALSKTMRIGSITGASASTNAGATSGDAAYNQMMAEMHPDQVAQSAQQSEGAQMVGGC